MALNTTSIYERYGQYLPEGPGLDLGQGFTPVLRSRSIGPKAGIKDLVFKMEHLNPTGSYKDRFAGLAVGRAAAAGKTRCVATSSGNGGAALAAFCARAGLTCTLFIAETTPPGKLGQMRAHGAELLRVEKFAVDAAESERIMNDLNVVAAAGGLELFITCYAISPVPMEGIKTIAYELDEQLGAIEDVFVPVGGGGLYVAIARGFADLALPTGGPHMNIVQPSGNDTVVTPLAEGAERARSVGTSTAISGLGVGHDLDGSVAMGHARRTGGHGYLLPEEEIFVVQQRLAIEEGIFVEPAGAVSVAGALMAARAGRLGSGPTVCILTGHGFKDPDSVGRMGQSNPVRDISRADIPAILAP